MSAAKQMAKATKPFITNISSSKVRGTSRETTNRVTANANTASENPSRRDQLGSDAFVKHRSHCAIASTAPGVGTSVPTSPYRHAVTERLAAALREVAQHKQTSI